MQPHTTYAMHSNKLHTRNTLQMIKYHIDDKIDLIAIIVITEESAGFVNIV